MEATPSSCRGLANSVLGTKEQLVGGVRQADRPARKALTWAGICEKRDVAQVVPEKPGDASTPRWHRGASALSLPRAPASPAGRGHTRSTRHPCPCRPPRPAAGTTHATATRGRGVGTTPPPGFSDSPLPAAPPGGPAKTHSPRSPGRLWSCVLPSSPQPRSIWKVTAALCPWSSTFTRPCRPWGDEEREGPVSCRGSNHRRAQAAQLWSRTDF